VEPNDVLQLIYSVEKNIQGYKMDSIDIYKIDRVLKKHPFIRSAAIYKTVSGKLKIDVVQRRPLLMVINNSGQSYYIDKDGIVFETSKKSSPPVIVANGFIKDKFDFSGGKVYKINLENTGTGSVAADLFRLIKLIDGDDFWRDQIEQIYVNSLSEYELVPMLGGHILALGTMEEYDRKMYVLKEFYFRGLGKTGWNTYKSISVKYKNQIVCKRS
jgi:cell division protein FtsQ